LQLFVKRWDITNICLVHLEIPKIIEKSEGVIRLEQEIEIEWIEYKISNIK
jgi:hypothetical protein